MELWAAQPTRITGSVVDVNTGETLPFVQILFEKSSIGTTTDLDGLFSIENSQNLTTLSFRMVGYKTKTLSVKAGKTTELFVPMEPEVYALQDVVVKPNKKREHYRRKGNPAVELIKNVIANKDKNRVGRSESYKVESYEKHWNLSTTTLTRTIFGASSNFSRTIWTPYNSRTVCW